MSDWPAVAFGPELIEAYPEAKVILSTRNVESWHKFVSLPRNITNLTKRYSSTMQTVWWRVTDPELRFLSKLDWSAGLYYPMLKRFFDTFFRGDFPNSGKLVFKEHYAEIVKLVHPDNLLEYSVSEGWEPLCKFLQVQQPKGVDFPTGNNIDNFKARCKKRNRMQALNVIFGAMVYLLICWMLYTMVRGGMPWLELI